MIPHRPLNSIILLVSFLYSSLCYTFQPPLSNGQMIWDLYATDLTTLDVLTRNWEIYNLASEPSTRTSYCAGYSYKFFGGVGLFPTGGYLERVYSQLPSHTILYYAMTIAAIGSWQPNDYISLQFGTSTPKMWNLSSILSTFGANSMCGSQNILNYQNYLVGRVFHTEETLRITIQYNLATSAIGFGFRDIVLTFRNISAGDVEEHYITLGNTGIPGSTKCAWNQYFDTTSGTCKSCPTGCGTCFGSTTSQCYRCAWGYSFVGSACIKCATGCGHCKGPNAGDCVICTSSSYLLDYDHVCRSSCTSPTVQQGSGDVKVCVSPCTTGQYLIWNNTCVDACTSPLTQSTQTGLTFCDSPCNQAANEYYYWNASCITTCDGYYARTQDGYSFCDACQSGYFRYENGSCLSTCDSPFTQSSVGGSQFCNFPCGYSANEYYYWNTSCLPTCTDYYPTTEGGYLYCEACQPGYFRYENGSCLSTCDSPFTQSSVGGSQFCNFPCNYAANEYYYWNTSCLSTCADYYPISQGGYLYCDACQSGYFRYENGSCLSICDSPFTQSSVGGSQFCNSPCNYVANEYYYWNTSCLSTCADYYPISQGGYLYCDACQPGYFRYQNGSCLLTCEIFFNQVTIGGSEFCNFPCNANELLNWDGSCVAECDMPLSPISLTVGKMCSNPCTDSTYYYYEEENACMPTCDSPYEASVQFSINVCQTSDESVEAEAKGIAQATSIMACIMIAIGIVNSIFGRSFELVMLIYMTKMLEYIKYLDIVYPPKVQIMLENQLSISGIFSFPEFPNHAVENWFTNYPLPGKLGNGDFYSSFVPNFFNIMIMVLVLTSIIALLKVLELYAWKSSSTKTLIQKIIITFKWNFFLTAFCGNYDDMILYTCLQIITLNNDLQTVLSMTVCLIFNYFGIYVLVKIIMVNRALKTTLNDAPKKDHKSKLKEFKEKWEHFEVFFGEFKTESFSQQMFTIIIITRMIFFSIIIGALFNHPLLQASLLVSLSLLMSVYLISKKPLKLFIHQAQRVICELIILIYNICVLSLAVLDHVENENPTAREAIGDLMVYIVIGMNSLFLVFEGINMLLLAKFILSTLNRKKLQKVVPIRTPSKLNLDIQALYKKSTIQLDQAIETSPSPKAESQSTRNQFDLPGKSMFAVFGHSSSKVEPTSDTSILASGIMSPPSSQARLLYVRPQSNRKSTFLEDQEQRRRVPSISRMRQSTQSELTIINQSD